MPYVHIHPHLARIPDSVEQVAQQMSGRAGRRGLDTQGNLLYMNMAWPKIQGLMLGDIPAIVGKDPQYPTIALHHALSGEEPVHINTYVDSRLRWLR